VARTSSTGRVASFDPRAQALRFMVAEVPSSDTLQAHGRVYGPPKDQIHAFHSLLVPAAATDTRDPSAASGPRAARGRPAGGALRSSARGLRRAAGLASNTITP